MTTLTPPPAINRPPPIAGLPGRGTRKTFGVKAGVARRAERVVIYGCGGIGKSTLASLAPDPVFVDINSDGTSHLNVKRVGGVETYQDVRDALAEPSLWKECRTVVIDTATDWVELSLIHTIATVRHEKSEKKIEGIEDYGYGKGYRHWYDSCVPLLGDLDTHIRAGRNVIVVCHDCTEKAPNPDGDDFLRYEPALLQKGQDARFRDRVKNWTDHLLYVAYDKLVENGKATGTGTRTIYPVERPTYWAKSRTLRDPIFYEEGSDRIWRALGIKQEGDS